MKYTKQLTLCLLCLTFYGCANLRTKAVALWETGKIQSSLSIAARTVGLYVGKTVLAVAMSPKDAEKKADILQGLTEALWTNVGQLLDPTAIYELAKTWLPDKPHWQEAAVVLSTDFKEKLEANPDMTKEEVAEVLHGYASGIYESTEL